MTCSRDIKQQEEILLPPGLHHVHHVQDLNQVNMICCKGLDGRCVPEIGPLPNPNPNIPTHSHTFGMCSRVSGWTLVQVRRDGRTHLYAFFMSSGDAPFSRPSTLYRLSPAVDSLRCGLFWSSMFQDVDNCDISETLPVSAKRKCGSRYKLRTWTEQRQHTRTLKVQWR